MAEVDAEAISNDPRTASGIDPSYQPYHDIQPPSNATNLSNPTEPMDPSQQPHQTADDDEEPIQPPKDFTEHFPSRLPVPPFIHVQGVPNFRDLGGYSCPPPPSITSSPTEGGKTYMVRKNLLFRCAHPTQLTSHGATTLRDLGITNIYDLRSAPEIDKFAQLAETPTSPTKDDGKGSSPTRPNGPPPLDTSNGFIVIPGIDRTFTPVYEREDYSPVALARKLQWYTSANGDKNFSEGFVNAYRDIATFAATGGSYATILRQTLKSAENMAAHPAMGRRRRPTSAVPTLDFLIQYQEEQNGSPAHSRTVSRSAGDPPPPTTSNPNPSSTAEDDKATTNNANSSTSKPAKSNGGLIFHCTAGKDRTGVLAALILTLLRVPIDAIAWEYAITEPGLGSWRDLFIDRISQGGLGGPSRDQASQKATNVDGQNGSDSNAKNSAETGGVSSSSASRLLTRAEAARICSSRAANMRAFLEQVLEPEFGGAEKYLVDTVGLSQEEVDRLKELLVVEVQDEGEVVKWEGVRIEGWTLERGMNGDEE